MSEKILHWVQKSELCAVSYPSQTATYLFATALLSGLICYWVFQNRSGRAFWSVIGLILINIAFFNGEDTAHHVFRIAQLAEDIKQGNFSLLFTDPATGDVYPVFVYYSFLPYILPVALKLFGLSALLGFKIAMALQLVVFAAGLHALLKRPVLGGDTQQLNAYFLSAILFVSATYTYDLWLKRAAFGELWAFSLAPWVVRFALSPSSIRPLAAMLFLQIASHPLVFLQSAIGEAIVAFGLSRQAPAVLFNRGVRASLIALALATPFWLPQFIWLHDILGNAALPVNFSDTFLSLGQLVNPAYTRNVGLFLPCAVILMVLATGARTPWRTGIMIASLLVLIALQTVYLRRIAVQAPILNQSQFVWRLMAPTAFIEFGALLTVWDAANWPGRRGFPLLALLSVGWMVVMQLAHAPRNFLDDTITDYGDVAERAQYFDREYLWGLGLFAPDYSRLAQNCDAVDNNDITKVNFRDLQKGVDVNKRFVYLEKGPIGFVSYYVDGARPQESACRDGLVLGPLESNKHVTVSESVLNWLMRAREATLIICLFVFLAPIRPLGLNALSRNPRIDA